MFSSTFTIYNRSSVQLAACSELKCRVGPATIGQHPGCRRGYMDEKLVYIEDDQIGRKKAAHLVKMLTTSSAATT